MRTVCTSCELVWFAACLVPVLCVCCTHGIRVYVLSAWCVCVMSVLYVRVWGTCVYGVYMCHTCVGDPRACVCVSGARLLPVSIIASHPVKQMFRASLILAQTPPLTKAP